MSERVPFKEGLNVAAIEHLAGRLVLAQADFPVGGFVEQASRGIDDLELKDRVRHVIEALRNHLPSSYPRALEVLLETAEHWIPADREDGLGSFGVWPLIDFVGEHGVDHFDASMAALRAMTGLWSAEFAIRSFLIADPARAFGHLRSWLDDSDHHVRRLVSEGSRSRLPWGRQLPGVIADPAPVVELLQALRDDPSEYVRRSVANNLNDLSKDHPELVVEICSEWFCEQDSKERRKLVKHALRTLVKDGHAGALGALGFDPDVDVAVEDLRVAKAELGLGETQIFSFDLVSKSDRNEQLVVDYAVHLVKKAGHRSAKVFKLKTLQLAAGQSVAVEKRHGFKRVTVRSYHPGQHAIEVLVNGRSRAQIEFDLRVTED